jgi:hypothetical protein
MNQNSRGLHAHARLVADEAVVTVIGCTGYPLWSVRIRWPWSPLDRQTVAELSWLGERTGITPRAVVAALARLGMQHREWAA